MPGKQLVENKSLTTGSSGVMLHGMTDMPWTPPDAPRARAEREYTALFRIHQRHANDPARRDRGRHLPVIGPGEAGRLVVGLAAGGLGGGGGWDAGDPAHLAARA